MKSLIKCLPLVWLCLGAAQAFATPASNDGQDSSVSIDKNLEHYVVNADGTFTVDVDEDVRIDEERAIKNWAQMPLSYNQTLEKIEIVGAYTRKADGRRVAVQPEQIKDQQEARSANAPMFQDSRVKVVIFPEVAVGDHLVLQYRLTRLRAMFPGQFEDLSLPTFHPTKAFELTYDMPPGVELHADGAGFSEQASRLPGGGTRHRWVYRPGKKARLENDSVAYTDYGDHLAVSTFTDYQAFARAYDERASDKETVTPAIRQLAQQLTAGLTDPRQKALALGDWVRRRIRYVAVYIGPGGVVPHPAEQVLDNRYGDCKDHVTLLSALLKAVGIDSSPALINARNAYRLPKVPTLGVMNHVINYLPGLDLYLDSTADSIAAGYLPVSDLDKPTLLTKQGKLGHTPATQPGTLQSKAVFTIDRDGAARIRFQHTLSGWLAEMNRYIARNSKPSDLDLSVERMLSAYGMKGEGTFDAGKADGGGDSYTVAIDAHTDNMVYLPGPVGIPTITNLMGGVQQLVYSLTSEKERTQSFLCLGTEASEEGRFVFPQDVQVIALPQPVTLKTAYLDYQSSIERDGSAVVVKRRLRFHPTGTVCSAADYRAMHQSLDQVIRDLRSQIIVKG